MTGARFRLREKAQRDVLSIGRYTERTWGREQRNKYLRDLDARFSELAASPGLGVARDDVKPGYRSFHQGHHIIFYRLRPYGIDVIRVLHESMDIQRHLAGNDGVPASAAARKRRLPGKGSGRKPPKPSGG